MDNEPDPTLDVACQIRLCKEIGKINIIRKDYNDILLIALCCSENNHISVKRKVCLVARSHYTTNTVTIYTKLN